MRLRKVALVAVVVLILDGCASATHSVRSVMAQHQQWQQLSVEPIQQAVATLASDEFSGRRAGTSAAVKASNWLAQEFQSIGLIPAGTDGYTWPFTFTYTEHSALPELEISHISHQTLRYRRDYAATLVSGAGLAEAEVVFVGYAMVAPELNYDDFAGVDLTGKIALVVRGAPGVGAEVKPEYRSQQVKDANVAARGGVGILYVARPKEYRGDELQRKYSVMAPVKLPAVEISREVADKLLGTRVDLGEIVNEMDRRRKPHPFATGWRAKIKTQVTVDPERADLNVLGLLKGSDPAQQDRVVIIGAHYDHMGTDVDGAIFHGAYDNASGVATLLTVARILAADPPRCSVLFAAWGAEESGMVGSSAYRNAPGFRGDRLVGVINLDTIGRSDILTIELSRTDQGAAHILDFAQQLKVKVKEMGHVGPSDGMTFAKLPVPVIQVVDEGSTNHIHTLVDQVEGVNVQRLAAIARLVALQTWWWGDWGVSSHVQQ